MKRPMPGIATGLLVVGLSTTAIANGSPGPDWAETYFRQGGNDAPACGACHAMAAAETSGQVGPDLDVLQPDRAKLRAALRDGVGVMPSFAQALSEAQIKAMADYVAEAVE
ncbi:MAG TPA: cytochrome c [Roseovarius sp.]|nr:cytochrome c [Roseovarius sp.]